MIKFIYSKFKSLMKNGLKSNFSENDLLYTQLVNIFTILCFLYLFSLGLLAYIESSNTISIISIIISIGCIINFFTFRFIKSLSVASYFLVFLIFIMQIFLLLLGGKDGTGYLWVSIFPLVIFILLGYKKGIAATLIFIMSMLIIFYIIPTKDLGLYEFSSTIKSRVLLSFFGESFLAFIFSYLVNKYMTALERSAKTDLLTQLPNRRDMYDKLSYTFGGYARELYNSSRNPLRNKQKINLDLSIAMLDIDFFKKFNDNYGHDIGDLVLQTIAKRIKSALRAKDIVSRWGGEEFLILLADTNKEGAKVALEKVRKIIEDNTLEHEGKDLKITASIGYMSCCYEQNEIISNCNHKVKELIKKADTALYKAKAKGRNRIEYED